MFDAAATTYGAHVLAPGGSASSTHSTRFRLGLALMFGTAGLPHILMRFYTVRDAKTARVSVAYATGLIAFFYLLTFVLGYGAVAIVGRERIIAVDPGGNMAAPLLAESSAAARSWASSRPSRSRRSSPSSRADVRRRRDPVARLVGQRVPQQVTPSSASSWLSGASPPWAFPVLRDLSRASRSRDRTSATW